MNKKNDLNFNDFNKTKKNYNNNESNFLDLMRARSNRNKTFKASSFINKLLNINEKTINKIELNQTENRENNKSEKEIKNSSVINRSKINDSNETDNHEKKYINKINHNNQNKDNDQECFKDNGSNKTNSSKLINFTSSTISKHKESEENKSKISSSIKLSKNNIIKESKKNIINLSETNSKKSSKNSSNKDINDESKVKDDIKNKIYEKNIDNNANNDNINNNINQSKLRLEKRNYTINNNNVFAFKSFFKKTALINFGQNKIKLNLENVSKNHSKKTLPNIKSNKVEKDTQFESLKNFTKIFNEKSQINNMNQKYVYSYEEKLDTNYKNNILFISRFSKNNNDKDNSRVIKCFKQKASELFLSPIRTNYINKNYSKDNSISPNRLKLTSSSFWINSGHSSGYSLNNISQRNYEEKTDKNLKKFEEISNFNIKNDLDQNNINTLCDINSNTKNTNSSKITNLGSKDNNCIKNIFENYYQRKKNSSRNNLNFKEINNLLSEKEIKNKDISIKKTVEMKRSRRERDYTLTLNNNFQQSLNNISNNFGIKSNKFSKKLKKNLLRQMLTGKNIINNNKINSNNNFGLNKGKKNILKKFFFHSKKEFKKLKYNEKDYLNHQKEKIENIIINDDFGNRRCNNEQLIIFKKDFLDEKIVEFIKLKSKELMPEQFLNSDREILFLEDNKKKEDYLYNLFKYPKKYIFNSIYINNNLNIIIKKNYLKLFYPSNKIKQFQINILSYNNIIINKKISNFIINYIEEKYNLYSYIFETIAFRRELRKYLSRKLKKINHKSDDDIKIEIEKGQSYILLKINLFLIKGFLGLIQNLEQPFKYIESKRIKAWNLIKNSPKEKYSNKKRKRGSIIFGQKGIGGTRPSYLSLLKNINVPREKEKEKSKLEKKSPFLPGRKRSLSISGNLFIKSKDLGKIKEDNYKKFELKKFSIKNRVSSRLDKLKNYDIILEEKSNDNQSSNDGRKKSFRSKKNSRSTKKLSSNKHNSHNSSSSSSYSSSSSSSGKLIIKDFEEFEEKIKTYNLCSNKMMLDRNINLLNNESLETRVNKFVQENNNKIIVNDIKNDMIIKSAGYDLLTKEAMSIKVKELQEQSPLAQLFNKFALLIEKRKETLFEELLKEEENKFKIEGKNFVNFLNMQQSYTGNTLLIYAAQYGDKNITQSLLMRNCDPNIQNIFGNTALHMAYKTYNMAIVYLLKGFGAKENIKNESGLRPKQMIHFEESII